MTADARILRMEVLHRLHSVIAFDRESVGDPRKPPNTLAAAFGALGATNAKYLRTLHRANGAKP
jgi:hypothetical protein